MHELIMDLHINLFYEIWHLNCIINMNLKDINLNVGTPLGDRVYGKDVY